MKKRKQIKELKRLAADAREARLATEQTVERLTTRLDQLERSLRTRPSGIAELENRMDGHDNVARRHNGELKDLLARAVREDNARAEALAAQPPEDPIIGPKRPGGLAARHCLGCGHHTHNPDDNHCAHCGEKLPE